MLPAVSGALLSLAVLIYVLPKDRYLDYTRRIRSVRPLRQAAIAVYSSLLLLNLWCAILMPSGLWRDVVIVGTLAATAIFGLLVSERRLPSMILGQRRKVLAVGAHPDDLELACGGTLAKLVDAGHEVRGLVMSQGERGGDENTRPFEARTGAAFLGLSDFDVLDFPDTRMETVSNDIVRAIESAIMAFQPDVIFTHSAHDQHQDHHAVHQATLRAARSHHSILCYESPSVTREFDPSVFVDINDYVDVKVQAVQSHRNQAGKPYMTPGRVRGMAAFRGAQAKNVHSEAFEPVRLLGSAIGDL
ncbi:PIG-L deacetylase family protein [Kocuria turfanensis]|uniref:PIG-L deacetylase family protein n=1 Tax=Kocuria turfanensis TaxID=388357 RepID=UPI00403594E4